MPIKLPNIDVDAISSLDKAKQEIRQLLNTFEQFFKLYEQQQKENILLKQEVARLKKQPKTPQFTSPQNPSFSASKLLKKDKLWHKLSRKKIEVDQKIQLPEVDRCICGSMNFTTVQTTVKIVQGMIIKRNNTAYHGKKWQTQTLCIR